jgi:hypothetical protein
MLQRVLAMQKLKFGIHTIRLLSEHILIIHHLFMGWNG